SPAPCSFRFFSFFFRWGRLKFRRRRARSRLSTEQRRLRRHLLPRRHIRRAGVLAQLQGADISHDVPAVTRRNLGSIFGHGPKSIGDHAVEIAEWSFPQAVGVKRWRRAEAALHDHAFAIAQPRMTWRTEDIEPLLPPRQNFLGHRKWNGIARLVAHFAGVEI